MFDFGRKKRFDKAHEEELKCLELATLTDILDNHLIIGEVYDQNSLPAIEAAMDVLLYALRNDFEEVRINNNYLLTVNSENVRITKLNE